MKMSHFAGAVQKRHRNPTVIPQSLSHRAEDCFDPRECNLEPYTEKQKGDEPPKHATAVLAEESDDPVEISIRRTNNPTLNPTFASTFSLGDRTGN